jgi:hypothetical protein
MSIRAIPRAPWAVVAALGAASAGLPLDASAAEFILIGNGSLQHLNYYSAGGNFCVIQSSGTVWSANGQFSDNRGTLSWTGTGRLQVVARVSLVGSSGTPVNCQDYWRAVNAEDFPLEFFIQSGNPGASLRITPTIVGSVSQAAGLGGYPSTLTSTLDFRMQVAVNGQVVTQDHLVQVTDQVTGQSVSWNPSFPKGNLNTVVVPGAGVTGTLVTVSVFAYDRFNATGQYTILASSPYGNELALVVTAEPVGPVGVAEPGAPERLSLTVSPNPSRARARVSYELPRATAVELAVYDIRGSRVATLVDRIEEAGRHDVVVVGRESRLAPGVYVVELKTDAERRTTKLAVVE